MLNIAELDERIDKCLAILADNPHSQVFAALADSYHKRGDFGRAFSVCKSGLHHHPDYAPAHIVMSKLFLHQGMCAEALTSVGRAIELDGSTRASDLLETEILLAIGDTGAARVIIKRLSTSDPGNIAVTRLLKRCKEIEHSQASSPAAPTPSGHSAPRVQDSPPPAKFQPRSAKPEVISWDEWAQEVSDVPCVTQAFAVDSDGEILAGLCDSDPQTSVPQTAASLFGAVDAALQERLKTHLEEIRIERPTGEVWCRRSRQGLIGFTGQTGLPFGAARQAAMVNAERASSEDALLDTGTQG